jgi:hypothetical protein
MKRHPTTNNNPAPTQKNTPLTRGDLTDPEKLILAAQKHFATGFPNERRVGCPAPGVIQAARYDQIPGDEIRAHLFRCSECFNEYHAAMRDRYKQAASNTGAADRRKKLMDLSPRWRLPMLAGATALLLLAAGLSIWRRQQAGSPQLSQNRPQRAPMASAGNPLTPRPPAQPLGQRAGQTANSGRVKPRLADSLAINLDLNRRSALGDSNRGGSLRDSGTKIKLPPRRALLKLRLRKGSGAGLYQISIVDPNSNPLVKTSARSFDGRSLKALLDLRRASQMAHRLRIECGDDMNEYLIEIERP